MKEKLADSKRGHFLTEERGVTLAGKRLSVGSVLSPSLSLKDVDPQGPGYEMRQRPSITPKEMYTEKDFAGYRDSILNEM